MTDEADAALASKSETVEVPISVTDPAWDGAGDGILALVRRAARAAIRNRGERGPLEISVLLTGDDEMRALNRRYRKTDSPTNVLAFASGDGAAPAGAPRLLGDVALAYGTVRREAQDRGLPIGDHIAHLVVHGVLHLLGYDHQTAVQRQAMEGAEVKILGGLGIADPYGGDGGEGANGRRP